MGPEGKLYSRIILLTSLLLTTVFMRMPAQELLNSYRWKSRVIILISDRPDHPLSNQQLKELRSDSAGLQERDIVLLNIPSDSLSQEMNTGITQKFPAPQSGFRFILIGKDGTVKTDRDYPVKRTELFAIIDAMPMRRREMRDHDDQ